MREREIKLSAGRDFRLPDFGGLPGDVVVTPRTVQRLSTVYYDSADLRLARWGISFRFRTGEGWTVKLPDTESDGLLVRDEVVFDGSPRTAPSGALDLVRGYLRGAQLLPRVRLRTTRQGILVHDAEGRLFADVVDDNVALVEGRRLIARFRELEVEATDDTPPRLLKALIARLRAAGAGAPDPTPKYVRAIGGPDAASPEIAPPKLSKSASVGEVVTYAIADGVIRLLRSDPVVRLQTDPEGVHQARVATRRLRSDLRTFGTALDSDWSAGIRAELAWLGGELGAARDADVLLERMTARVEELNPESDQRARPVLESLAESRARAHATLLDAFRSDRYIDLVERLIEAARAPALRQDEARRGAVEALAPIIRRAWRRLSRQAKRLSDPPADEELHRVRILAKRCRYAGEASAPALGKRIRKLARAARDLQDVLGELNDAVVAERWLGEWADRSGPGPSTFVAGELAGLERAAARRARRRWPKAWTRLKARRPTRA